MLENDDILQVVWPAAASVRAAYTTRLGGVSKGDYARLNLGNHVGDQPEAVTMNRLRVRRAIHAKPRFLQQVHGTAVVDLDDPQIADEVQADACLTSRPGVACLIMVADCLPVLIANRSGTLVGAAHCGWRGLSGVGNQGVGVLEALMQALRSKPQGAENEWIAWLGPAIGPKHFEVGPEVLEAFVTENGDDVRAFEPATSGKFRANLFALARLRLGRLNVSEVYGGGDCTYSQPERYFSHRRATHQSRQTGRQAAMIWLEPSRRFYRQ